MDARFFDITMWAEEMRQIRNLLTVVMAALMLCSCGLFDDSESTKSTAPEDLMRVAVPGWEAEGPKSVSEIDTPVQPAPATDATSANPTEASTSDSSGGIDTFQLSPGPVIRLADDRLVLIVSGMPANEQGNSTAGHASQGILGAYWFEKRGERWYKAKEDPGFAMEGFSGNVGKLTAVDLGNNQAALAVESGSCWQGSCGGWLALYRVTSEAVTPIYSDLINSDSEGASAACSDVLELKAGGTTRVPMDDYSSAAGCYNINGAWKIVPEKSGPGTLVIDFTGKMASDEAAPEESDTAPASDDEDEGSNDPDAEESGEYVVTMHAVNEQQTYSFKDNHYVLVKGKNPNPGL